MIILCSSDRAVDFRSQQSKLVATYNLCATCPEFWDVAQEVRLDKIPGLIATATAAATLSDSSASG